MFKWLKNWLCPKKSHCPHPASDEWIEICIHGKTFKLKSPMCQLCTSEYMGKYSTICGFCGQAILVDQAVATNFHGRHDYPYVHYTTECSLPGSFVGVWGEGKIRLDIDSGS